MLANLLAIIIGLASLAFYLAAFILPEVHRRSDFFWSGVGMFYAVVLWYCARQMNGAVLLGQTASVGLLLWLGYQTLRLRRMTTPAAQQTPIQLSKSERSRLAALRPLAKDYEFVEDGVEDAIDQEPDRPILIKSEAHEFALKMVVPAAIPQAKPEKTAPEEPAAQPPSPPQKSKKPSPLEAVGIFAGWVKEVITPKKQPPKPMIELPPRPPSIPKPDTAPEAAADNVDAPADQVAIAATPAIKTIDDTPAASHSSPSPSDRPADSSPVSNTGQPEPETVPSTDATQPPQSEEDSNWPDDDEDTNWPDDEFWE